MTRNTVCKHFFKFKVGTKKSVPALTPIFFKVTKLNFKPEIVDANLIIRHNLLGDFGYVVKTKCHIIIKNIKSA